METKVETTHLHYAAFLMSIGFELQEIKMVDEKHIRYVLINEDKTFHDFLCIRHAKKSKRNRDRLLEHSETILREICVLLKKENCESED